MKNGQMKNWKQHTKKEKDELRQNRSATCDDPDETCFSHEFKGTVTTGHDKCRFVDSLNDDSTTSVQGEKVCQLYTHADVHAMASAS